MSLREGSLPERLSQGQFMLISQWDNAQPQPLKGRPWEPSRGPAPHCLYSKEGLQFIDYNLPNPISGDEDGHEELCACSNEGLKKQICERCLAAHLFILHLNSFTLKWKKGLLGPLLVLNGCLHPEWMRMEEDWALPALLSTLCVCVPAAWWVVVLHICVSPALYDTSEVGITMFPLLQAQASSLVSGWVGHIETWS